MEIYNKQFDILQTPCYYRMRQVYCWQLHDVTLTIFFFKIFNCEMKMYDILKHKLLLVAVRTAVDILALFLITLFFLVSVSLCSQSQEPCGLCRLSVMCCM